VLSDFWRCRAAAPIRGKYPNFVEGGAKTRAEPLEDAPVTVLVVDDQETFRAALRDLVTGTPEMAVVGEACSGEGAVEAADRLSPALVIMDVRMPGMGGVEATRRMIARHPGIAVLLVSVDGRNVDPHSCGAVALLRKSQLSVRALREAWETCRR
jgi:two-component system, NarL family, invasion response regulator UvrY